MSETEQKETEIVAGVIEGVTRKKPASDDSPGTWQVAVKPDGSQYTKNLWTKDAELVSALDAKLGQHGAFVCNASYWENKSGQQVRSLWISGVSEEAGAATPPATSQGAALTARVSSSDTVDWDAKERRDYRSRAWAQTISAMTHTIKADESPGDIYRRLHALQRMIYRDIVRELDPEAFPDDDVPF